MKKILFLLLVCFIKLNAYEYIMWERLNATESQQKYIIMTDESGDLILNTIRYNGLNQIINRINDRQIVSMLSNIRNSKGIEYWTGHYVSKETFDSYYLNNLKFLNDLYTTNQYYFDAIMNYFYNKNNFGGNYGYIKYADYELLYNSDGLAVESIVEGVWAGLYSDSERGSSGKLYDSSGVLLYVNAEPVNTFQQWLDPLVRSVVGCLVTAVDLIASPVGVVISVVFVMAILYFVVTVGRRAIHPFDGKVRKRFLGSHNEEV